MNYEYVSSFLKQHKQYHYVKETSYSLTVATKPDKNGKSKTLVVMDSYFWQPKKNN